MRFAANNEAFSGVQFVVLHDNEYFEKLKYSGMVVAKCLANFKHLVETKTPNLNLLDIEAECKRIINEHNCVPTFYEYKGFPGAVCLSVNEDIVHGIPKDYILKEGDVITLDLGAHTECGVIADAAVTAIYGEPKNKDHIKLLETCEEALYKGISAIKVGEQIGCIGNAIYKYIRDYNFSLITQYGGHGLMRWKPHAQPFVANKAKRDEGIRIQPGLSIAIEPMLAIGSSKTKTLNDGWTVVTKDISVHVEHTIFVHGDSVEIMTWREDEQDKCPKRLYFDKRTA